MIERGSGRTSGLTDWRLMDVLSMWACLQDQDTTGQWKQVAGWRKVCDLALAHLSRLREYRRGLAEAWPPETNAAARAYLGELDQLIDQVQRTHDAAAANYDALAAATRAIGSTRAELQPLHDEYAEKVRQKRAYEEILADPKAVAGSRLPEKPPVTDAELEQLNVRARGLMTGLSNELQQAQVMLQRPPAVPRPGIETSDPDVYGGTANVPAIPPIVPAPIASPARRPLHADSSAKGPVAAPTAPGIGPVLGGASAAVVPPAPSPPNVTGPVAPAPPANGIGLPPTLPPITSSEQRRPGSPVNERLGPIQRPTGEGRFPQSPARPMQPGGLIGGTPGTGLGQPSSRALPPRRINPVGGVIGGGGAGTAPSGAAGSRPGIGRGQLSGSHVPPPFGGSPMGGALNGGEAGRPRNGYRQERGDDPPPWDPDNPWGTDQGVSPVVRPPDDPGPIDPGPAIGFDR
ncbi:hypothetical protein [Micromonospora chersina]|uniref:hypothetical protein n=1 Tax=Micromonospora chersina TaxID=47854 RepID=UPI0037106128